MNTHLYLVEHEVIGERCVSPVVGDDELEAYVAIAETFGANLLSVVDIDSELRRFVWDCCFEGMMNRWANL